MTDKLQSDAVMWGILKAVGVLALVGLVVGMCVNMRMPDFSSGLSGGHLPVRVLVTNMTPDSVVFMWSTKEGTLKGTSIVPPNASNVCARFDAKADTGTYRASPRRIPVHTAPSLRFATRPRGMNPSGLLAGSQSPVARSGSIR